MSQADSKSTSGQKQQQTNQIAQNAYPYPQQFEDETIDLYEMWNTICKRKWLVIAVTVVAAIWSVVYALVTPLVYKSEAVLLPPLVKDIQSLNVLGFKKTVDGQIKIQTGIEMKTEEVFSVFKQNFLSRNLHKKFILKNDLMEILAPERNPETRDDEIYKEFSELIKLEDKKGITSITIELHDPKLAAQWINDLVAFIEKETVSILVENKQNLIVSQIKDIEYTISSKRLMAKKRRQDKMVRYLESAQIAKDLGINRRVDATTVIQNTQMNVDISTSSTPLYYLGFEALTTEISVLKSRKSDDPFIIGLRDLEEQLALLRTIKVDVENVRAVNIDQPAYPSNNPIAPNRRMIVSASTVAGLFLGIFLAFFIEFVQNQRKRPSE